MAHPLINPGTPSQMSTYKVDVDLDALSCGFMDCFSCKGFSLFHECKTIYNDVECRSYFMMIGLYTVEA